MDIHRPLVTLPKEMGPDIWGPHYWTVFHGMVNWFRDTPYRIPNHAAACRWLLLNIDKIVPCPSCAAHAWEFLRTRMDRIINSTTRDSPAIIMWELHNHANAHLNKQQQPYMITTTPPVALDLYVISVWTVIVTQAALLRANTNRAWLFIELVDGLLPFMIPNRKGADMLSKFVRATRPVIQNIVANAVLGNDKDLLQYLENLRIVLLYNNV